MTTDFEQKLKQQLSADIDVMNRDVLDNVLRTPKPEAEKKSFFAVHKKRIVSLACAVCLLFAITLTPGMLSDSSQSVAPMSYTARTTDAVQSVSSGVEDALYQAEMNDYIEVAVTSYCSADDLHALASLDRVLTSEDVLGSLASQETVVVSLQKYSIINMMDQFYFCLPTEI